MELTQRPLEWELELEKEEEDVLKLEDDFRKKRQQLQLKKAQLEQKKLNDWEWEERRLKERLNEIDTEKQNNVEAIENTKQQVADFRLREIEIRKKQLALEEELMKATRLNHLEEIVRKKIELEKLQDKKKELENVALRENTRLEAIKEEQERRDYKSLRNLERIINKAENIDQALKRGDLDRQNQVLLASALEEGGDQAEKQRKRMVDEIIAKRQREQQQNLLDQEQKIKELNEERWKILNKHEDLLKKKQIHAKLVERGVDFLAEIELGQAPPKELIVQNLGNIEISSEDMYKPTYEILSEVSDELNHLDGRIKALRDQKEETLRYIQWINRPYNGEADIRRERPDLSLDTYVAMKELVYDLVDETWKKIAKFESDLDIINKNRNYYEHKSQVIEGTLDYLAAQQLIRIVTLQYVEDVVAQMTNDIAGDILSICKFSENIMFKFVGAAIGKHKNIKNEEEVPNYLKSLLKL